MQMLKHKNKQAQVSGMATSVLALVVAIVVLVVGAAVTTGVKDTQTTNSAAFNVSSKGEDALEKIGDFLPTLGLVIIAGIIIAVVVGSFIVFGRR